MTTLLLQPKTRRNRWFMPLVILVLAGGMAVWGMQNQKQRVEEVRQRVYNLCRDIGAGKDVSQQIQAMTPVENPMLLTELQRVCSSPKVVDGIRIGVERGDSGAVGSLAGSATHTAVIRAGDVAILGLRIKHERKPDEMQILGYWVPQKP